MTNHPGPPRLDDRTWMAKALCRGENPTVFFPEKGSTGWDTLVARRYCADCTVRAACRDYAIDNFIFHGIWGGMTVDERNAHRRNRRKKESAA